MLQVFYVDPSTKLYRAIDLVETRAGLLIGLQGYAIDSGNPRVSFGKLVTSYNFPEENVFIGNGYESKHQNATTYSDAGVIAKMHQYGLLGISLIFVISIMIAVSNKLSMILMTCWLVAFFKNDYFLSRYFFDLIFFIAMYSSAWKCYEYNIIDK